MMFAEGCSSKQIEQMNDILMKASVGYIIREANAELKVSGTGIQEAMEYLARKSSAGCAEGTLENYRFVLRYFCQWIGKELKDITDLDIIRFLDEFEQTRHIGKSRKDNIRIALNGFFTYLHNTGKISTNPMYTISKIQCEESLRERLSDLEYIKVCDNCTSLRDRALVEFLYSTGCRVSEVTNATIRDIDFDSKQLKVTGKGKKQRIVYLNNVSYYYLAKYLDSRKDSSIALFVSERNPHQPIKKTGVEAALRRIGERCLNRRLFPHLLRHTCACRLLEHGVTLDQVQVYLGHESPETTRVYAKTNPANLRYAFNLAMNC